MEPAPEADVDEINPQIERGCPDAAIGISFGVGFGRTTLVLHFGLGRSSPGGAGGEASASPLAPRGRAWALRFWAQRAAALECLGRV
jgi:hypothetical protein